MPTARKALSALGFDSISFIWPSQTMARGRPLCFLWGVESASTCSPVVKSHISVSHSWITKLTFSCKSGCSTDTAFSSIARSLLLALFTAITSSVPAARAKSPVFLVIVVRSSLFNVRSNKLPLPVTRVQTQPQCHKLLFRHNTCKSLQGGENVLISERKIITLLAKGY